MSSKKNKKTKKHNEPDKTAPEKEKDENTSVDEEITETEARTDSETNKNDRPDKPKKIGFLSRRRKKGFTLIQRISMRLGISSQNRSVVLQLSLERILSCFLALAALDFSCVFFTLGSLVYTKQCEVNGTLKHFGRSVFSFSTEQGLRGIIDSFTLTVFDNIGNPVVFPAMHTARFWVLCMAVLAVVQSVIFVYVCISTPLRINDKLKPLYTIAQATNALSYADLSSEEFTTLQDAINNISPTEPEEKLHTGKQEFIGMEEAVNNLLERTRSSYKSQVRFVSDAAHELRTPIAVIQGYANMLDRWGRDDKEILDEGIKSIKSEAENMNRLVENLLFLARGDSGRNVFRPQNIDFNKLLCDIYDEFTMIDEKHEFRLDLRDDITAQADSSLIKQCLRILVDNAVKYSPEGTDIILRLQKRDEDYFSIDVQDYGIGIKSEDIDKIFERFYRSDPARNRQGGTGLGLSIAKWIADKHEGYFEILSYENFGTRISLILPFKTE